MKKFFLLIVSFISMSNCSLAQSQGLSNHWLLGYESFGGYPWGISHFNFYSGSANIYYDSLGMNFNHTESTIADSAGNLLFYTNGCYIADVTGDTMQNGSGLNPGIYSIAFSSGFLIPQATLIIPKPDSAGKYYLFHNTADLYLIVPNSSISMHLYVTKVDMSLNGGLGGVLPGQKNISILNDSLNPGKIVACKHGNGRDWWVITHQVNTDLYYKFLITPSGIQGPYSQHIGAIHLDDAGQAKFSPGGSKFSYYFWKNKLEIFDFDRCTGMFSNPIVGIVDTIIGGNTGVEFSPNSELLYVSNGYFVYQYDLTAVNVLASKTTVAVWDTFVSPLAQTVISLRLQQLAPNGKIYITSGNGSEFMHVINYPDSLGMACNLVQHGLSLPSFYFNTLPNHPNYFLGRLIGSPCDTITSWQGISSPLPKEEAIKVLSNPNDGRFTLWFPVNKDAGWLEIYNTNGEVIRKLPVAPWSQYKQVDITSQPAGVYFCRMWWGDVMGSVKVIKAP